MTLIRIYPTYTIIVVLCTIGCTNTYTESIADRPNVILIMSDDQGYGDIAAHGNPHIKTPHLDELYKESIRLENFHVGTTCAPTRAALMTGRDGNRVGVWHTIAGRSQLAAKEKTMADVFSHNGYRTGMFGKWHLGDNYPFRPHDRGFDDALYHGGGGIWQGPDFWNNDYFDDIYYRNGEPEQQKGYCTDVWFNAAFDFMDQSEEQPFFAYVATNAPHFPFHVDSLYIRPYLGIADVHPNFNGMITNLDDNVGRMMKYLDDNDLADNTVLIFMTDNGTAAGARTGEGNHVISGYNANMRGKKVSQYEGGHRVPCYIRWPDGGWKGDEMSDRFALTAHIDILPTLIDKLGLDDMDIDFDGESLVAILDESDDAEGTDLSSRILNVDTQRKEHPDKWYKSCTMMDHWRLINGVELYDLTTDPSQKKDIAVDHPDIVQKLRDGYEEWWSDISPTFSRYTRTVIGENGEVVLYSHDWHETVDNKGISTVGDDGSYYVPWNQTQIREGRQVNGYWAVTFARSGTYGFELRRWPREYDRPIKSSIPLKKAVDGGVNLPIGAALSINKASVQIRGRTISSTDVSHLDHKVSFIADVEEGDAELMATFDGPDGVSLGAYYLYVTRL